MSFENPNSIEESSTSPDKKDEAFKLALQLDDIFLNDPSTVQQALEYMAWNTRATLKETLKKALEATEGKI